MNYDFLIVYGAWLGFLILHSLFVSAYIKEAGIKRFGNERYRLIRIVTTTFLLTGVLTFHWSVYAPTLVNLGLLYRFFGIVCMLLGGVLILGYLKNIIYNNPQLPRPILDSEGKPTLRVLIRNRIRQHITDYSFFRVKFPGYTGALLFTCGYPLYFPTEKNYVTVTLLAVYFIMRLIHEEKKLKKRKALLASQKLKVYKTISYSVQKRVS
jgi:hypothetical protein